MNGVRAGGVNEGEVGPIFYKEEVMLVLQREIGESIYIDTGRERIVVAVVRLGSGKVRLGFDAPPHVAINRSEVADDAKTRKRNEQESPT